MSYDIVGIVFVFIHPFGVEHLVTRRNSRKRDQFVDVMVLEGFDFVGHAGVPLRRVGGGEGFTKADWVIGVVKVDVHRVEGDVQGSIIGVIKGRQRNVNSTDCRAIQQQPWIWQWLWQPGRTRRGLKRQQGDATCKGWEEPVEEQGQKEKQEEKGNPQGVLKEKGGHCCSCCNFQGMVEKW